MARKLKWSVFKKQNKALGFKTNKQIKQMYRAEKLKAKQVKLENKIAKSAAKDLARVVDQSTVGTNKINSQKLNADTAKKVAKQAKKNRNFFARIKYALGKGTQEQIEGITKRKQQFMEDYEREIGIPEYNDQGEIIGGEQYYRGLAANFQSEFRKELTRFMGEADATKIINSMTGEGLSDVFQNIEMKVLTKDPEVLDILQKRGIVVLSSEVLGSGGSQSDIDKYIDNEEEDLIELLNDPKSLIERRMDEEIEKYNRVYRRSSSKFQHMIKDVSTMTMEEKQAFINSISQQIKNAAYYLEEELEIASTHGVMML